MSVAVKLLIIICLILVFQNFSEVSLSDHAQDPNAPQEQVVMPLEKQRYGVRQIASPAQSAETNAPCGPDDRRTVFLRLIDIEPGTRLYGIARDADTDQKLEFDIIVGQDQSIGACANPSSGRAGVVKVCFPEKVGNYFDLKLNKGDVFFASQPFCEHESMAIAVDLKVGAFN